MEEIFSGPGLVMLVTLTLLEIVLGIAGLLMLFIFRKNELVMGIGAGLIIQTIIMLTFDIMAEARGLDYISWLRKL